MSKKASKPKLPDLSPILSMSQDHRLAIFRRSRSRSLNTPELAFAHESLTSWLNGENDWQGIDEAYRNGPESIERISDLLALVKRETLAFEASAPDMYPYFYGSVDAPTPLEKRGVIVQFSAISRAMSDYATVPFLAFQPKTKLWGIGQRPAGLGTPMSFGLTGVRGRPYGEVMAAHGILVLARSGALDRIRRCDCDRWYYAKRVDGVACSGTCRKRIHDKKPAVIEKRAQQARTNSTYKSGKVYVNENG